LEIFAPVHDKAAHKQVLQVLKALQECLGDFQDSEVQADALRSFAGEMSLAGAATPGTLLAMGELAAALHAAQEGARAAFAGTFAAFMRPKNQRSFAALQPAARPARTTSERAAR
jgi:CHAD domain-containing protein